MRLFVAVWPSPDAIEALDRLPRPDEPAVRWTRGEQWHVTLRFFGEVDDDRLADLAGRIADAAAGEVSARAVLGASTSRLGPGALVVPVAGLDGLAAAVAAGTADVGEPARAGAFRGHVTVARARGRGRVPASLAGLPVGAAAWDVVELSLVRSLLGAGGARYEVASRARLGRPAR